MHHGRTTTKKTQTARAEGPGNFGPVFGPRYINGQNQPNRPEHNFGVISGVVGGFYGRLGPSIQQKFHGIQAAPETQGREARVLQHACTARRSPKAPRAEQTTTSSDPADLQEIRLSSTLFRDIHKRTIGPADPGSGQHLI